MTVTVYVPVAAVVAFVSEGFCVVLANPFGPLHAYVAVPGVVVLAVRFKVFPLHTGPLLAAIGVAGGEGSTSVKGPTILEGQLFNVTEILL